MSAPTQSNPILPTQAINKSFAVLPVIKDKLENFQNQLSTFLNHLNTGESEEHNKNLLGDLLKNINFNPDH